MHDLLDIRVTELLCSRLCHELASPVGAINNGIEMIEEFDESMMPEAMPLIGSSARLVADRLKFYRMAYGMAGTRSLVAPKDVKELCEAFLSDGRSTLIWPENGETLEFRDGWGKLLLNLLPLATETLPRGGSIGIKFDSDANNDEQLISVTAEGQGARVPEDCLSAMVANVGIDDLTPRSVHTFFLVRLAARLDSQIELDDGKEDQITLSVRLSR